MGRLLNENDVYALFAPNGTARLHVADIDVLPRVDAVEVVHGRWIETEFIGVSLCSCCNKASATPDCTKAFHNYCHNCGAKMDLED
jgi:hypothetical protein